MDDDEDDSMDLDSNASVREGSRRRTHSRTRIQPRKFFHSAAVWDPALKTVVLREGVYGKSTVTNGVSTSHSHLNGRGRDYGEVHVHGEGDGDEMLADGEEGWTGDASLSVES